VAIVEEVRPKLVGQVNSGTGGRMLYGVEVLAKFSVNGDMHERWIKVEQTPERLEEAQLQKRLWSGKSYFVRWNPADPDQIVIDVH
jgi:hypothetical protein